MKRTALLLSSLLISVTAQAITPSKNELKQTTWQPLALNQQQTIAIPTQATNHITGAVGAVLGYQIPANQGTLKINIQSPVQKGNTVFVPNVLVLDSQLTPSLNYPASQFKFSDERGLSPAQYHAELSLTPTANQDFIYLLIYTTEKDLQGKTTMTHPAKLLAKAKGNQPPAIADISVQHSSQGKLLIEVEGHQENQIIGLSGALFESKKAEPAKPVAVAPTPKAAAKPMTKPVESSTENYFNQAVLNALKQNDVNKAMNLVNEAEQLGLKQPRQIFLKHISVQK